LDISRIESGRMELELKPVNLKDLIGETVSALDPLIDKKGLVLETAFDEGLPLAHADPDRVRQVVTNLVDNAMKFTSEGRITVRAKASEMGLNKDKRPKFVEVCISDTGRGIRKRDLNRLFDKFRTLDTLATSQYKGAGLGLSICKGLVEIQGGTIWVKSKYRQGTTFCFTLPVSAGAMEQGEKALRQDYQVAGVLEREKPRGIEVLVVDDEPDHVELIGKILKGEGCRITKAYDGEEAIESVKRSKPHLIILDLMMPNVSGFDVIDYLKGGKDTRGIPIIVVTGKELTREQTAALDGRVERIVKKGFVGAEGILEQVRKTLDKFELR
jgi:CheY-like chemotaxis protein/anti-sigma regulatory factor (Ser/Thr protein kinase)